MKRTLIIALIMTFCLVGCQSKEDVSTDIENHLNQIVNDKEVSASSNPMDYIKNNQQDYDNIINKGDEGLEYLVGELKNGKQNGLKKWIIAKAITDMMKDNSPSNKW